MRKKIILVIIVVVLAGGGYFLFHKKDKENKENPTVPQTSANTEIKQPKSKSVNTSNEETDKYTINNQSSIYFIVNKQRALPSTFVPQNLVTIGSEQFRSDTAASINSLIQAARNDGINYKIISGYRSYIYQAGVYNGYVKSDGQAKAGTYSARPGHSEHQLGLAADLGNGICDLQACFGDTKAGKWLSAHAHEYGFIIRYQKGKENLTGYQYEPWHIRYVGNNLAEKIHQSGKTMEQFFGLSSALNY